jgi:hypothetical protein
MPHSADSHNGIESPAPYLAHAVEDPEPTVHIRVAVVGALVDKNAHVAPFRLTIAPHKRGGCNRSTAAGILPR